MEKLTENILSLVERAVAQHGVRMIEQHTDIYLLDDLVEQYLNESGGNVVLSIKELLNSPEKFNHICEDYHIILVQSLLNSLLELQFTDGLYLIHEPLFKNHIFVDCSFYY